MSSEKFNQEVEKRMAKYPGFDFPKLNYKGRTINTYPNMGKVGVQIDSYTLNTVFDSSKEAISVAKNKIDQMQ